MSALGQRASDHTALTDLVVAISLTPGAGATTSGFLLQFEGAGEAIQASMLSGLKTINLPSRRGFVSVAVLSLLLLTGCGGDKHDGSKINGNGKTSLSDKPMDSQPNIMEKLQKKADKQGTSASSTNVVFLL